MKTIKISEIVIDAGTQQREKINDEIVEEYAEAMKCGAQFPAVTVFFNSVEYYLADGFHRFFAHKHAEIDKIEVDVYEGTKRDAKFYSLGANKTHGLRRSNEDKKKAVLEMITDAEWNELPSRDIGNHIGVSHTYVSKLRREMEEKSEDNLGNVSKKPLKPALNRDNNQELSAGIEEGHEESDPKEHELQEAHDTINHLADENTKLRDALAAGQLPDDEIVPAERVIVDLRKQIKYLEAELDAVKSSRDIYQTENAQLKRQLTAYMSKIKKLGK